MTKAETVLEKISEIGLPHILLGTGLLAGITGGAIAIRKYNDSQKADPSAVKSIFRKLRAERYPGFGDADHNRDIDNNLVALTRNPTKKDLFLAEDYLSFIKSL